MKVLSDLNVCTQKGLVERFDSTIGAGYCTNAIWRKVSKNTNQGMVAKIPVLSGETNTCNNNDLWI